MGTHSDVIRQKLEYLSKLPETEYPFISLYMNIHSHQLFEQAEKNRIFLKDAFGKSLDQLKQQESRDKWTTFLDDQKKITNYIDTNLDSRAHGVAIFACEKLGIFETFQSLMPFDNSFIIDSFPHLRQLAYQMDEYENTLVIMLDSKYSRIFNIKLGGFVINEIDTESMVHRFHEQGGWAQARYERHIEDQIHHHYKEVAEIATEFLDKEHYENVILIGQEHEIKMFQLDLPKRVNMRIIDIDSLQRRENINDILGTVIENLRETQKARELNTITDIINKTQGGGHETLGMQDTIELAKQGRVSVLATVRDLVFNGWKCDGCFYVSKDQHHGTCPKCNGDTKETDLVEEAIRLTYKNGGLVELVENEAAVELEKHGGIGACLRY
ncbi:MAG: eRF1 protein [uncultured bacterium]|nr:MAG: eRF1 protein [uncultured bacterium]